MRSAYVVESLSVERERETRAGLARVDRVVYLDRQGPAYRFYLLYNCAPSRVPKRAERDDTIVYLFND